MSDNYFKKFDGQLWDVFAGLGDTDFGEFDPAAGIYQKQPYELGELPLSVLGKAMGYVLQKGNGSTRVHQLHEDGLVLLRKTGKNRPSFVSLLVDDHDEFFRLAGLSRLKFGKLINPERKIAAKAPQGDAKPQSVPKGMPGPDSPVSLKYAYLDGLPNDEARWAILPQMLPKFSSDRELKDFWRFYKQSRLN